MIHFLNITIQCKSLTDNDWRAFLDWADSETMTRCQLRGYGTDPGAAATDAWRKYNEDRDFYCEDEWKWE